MSNRPAVFLDRDGTLIDDPGFLSDPAGVRLLPGAVDALRRLSSAGYHLVVISNQSGIGRGLLTQQQVVAVNLEISRQFEAGGVNFSGWYWCPHQPAERCDCRKPGTLNHRLAASELGIDLTASWCVGDRIGDASAAEAIGARGILVLTGDGSSHRSEADRALIPVADDLSAVAELILGTAATPECS